MRCGTIPGMIPQGKGREGIGRDRKGTHFVSLPIETSSSSVRKLTRLVVDG